MSVGLPQAAGVTGILTAAGMSSGEVREWFRLPSRDLNGMSPATLVAVRDAMPELVPAAGVLLLECAQREASRRRAVEIELEEIAEREQAEGDELQERRDIQRDEQRAEREESGMDGLRYAGLVYHAIRLGGRTPLVAGWRALRVLRREAWCNAIGHDWSWTRAHELGAPRRVCRRCLKVQPREQAAR